MKEAHEKGKQSETENVGEMGWVNPISPVTTGTRPPSTDDVITPLPPKCEIINYNVYCGCGIDIVVFIFTLLKYEDTTIINVDHLA